MSIETLLEAAKFVEWSSQIQHTARDNETRPDNNKGPPPGAQPVPAATQPSSHQMAPTTSHSPHTQPIAVSPRAPNTKPGITSPLPQEPPWKAAGPTSPRPLEASNRPLMHQVARGPPVQRVVTPPGSGASYMGVQYRPLAPLPSAQSPNGSTQPLVSYRRMDSFDEGSNQSMDSTMSKGNQDEDKKSDTREVHNKLEKNRRAHLKDCFDNLKAQVPNMEDKKIKTSNLSILQGALRYLQALKRKERELEHQLEKLARQKITYQQRLAKLKIEKRLSEDQLPWNRNKDPEESEEEEEMEERAAEDDDQASTSTASEAEEEERKSRAQSPEVPSPPQRKSPKKSMVRGQPKQQQSIAQGQPQHQQPTTTNRNPDEVLPKVTHSVTKEIHSGPYVISRQIITHMAQQPPPAATRPRPTGRLPIISQLARRQAGRPIISAFEERLGVMNKNIPSDFNLTNVNAAQAIRQSELVPPVATQPSNSQSGNRQTVSQLLGKQTPGVRASMRPLVPSNHTPVIQAPLRQPLIPGAPYPVIGVTTAPSGATVPYPVVGATTAPLGATVPYPVVRATTAPPGATVPYPVVGATAAPPGVTVPYPVVGATAAPPSAPYPVAFTRAPSSAAVVTIAGKQTPTTSVTSAAVSRPAATSAAVHTASTTAKSVIQPPGVVSTVGPSTSALRAISPAPVGAQIHTAPNGVTLANVAPPGGVVPTRTVTQPFLSQIPMQPSALTQVLFTQPPVAAYSLAHSQLANPLMPSALPQTVIRPPAVAMTTVPQSVITQIITTQPMMTNTTGKVTQVTTQAITTPALASMVPPGVSPYHSLAALGVAPYPVTLGPPLALNKALVTTTPAYTTLPLGSAALQKLTMSNIPFQAPTIPITAAGTTQAAILSPLTGLRAAAPMPVATTKVPSVPMTMPIAMTTPVAMTAPVMNPQAIRPRVTVDPSTLKPGISPTTIVKAPPTISKGGARLVAPKPSGVRITVPSKDKPPQGVTTSQMAQIMAQNKNALTTTKAQVSEGTKTTSSNVTKKQVTVNQ